MQGLFGKEGKHVGELPNLATAAISRPKARAISPRGAGEQADLRPTLYEKLGFVPLEVTAGQLGDRPEPLPMFLEVGLVPAPTGSSEA